MFSLNWLLRLELKFEADSLASASSVKGVLTIFTGTVIVILGRLQKCNLFTSFLRPQGWQFFLYIWGHFQIRREFLCILKSTVSRLFLLFCSIAMTHDCLLPFSLSALDSSFHATSYITGKLLVSLPTVFEWILPTCLTSDILWVHFPSDIFSLK